MMLDVFHIWMFVYCKAWPFQKNLLLLLLLLRGVTAACILGVALLPSSGVS